MRYLKNSNILRLLLMVAFLMLTLSNSRLGDNGAKVGEFAPDFKLADLNGKMVSLSDLKGKFVVIHIAATW